MFTKQQLKQQIKAMGIQPGDTVLIHISLRAVGETENGADGIIDAFRECLPDGLFLVPTHTWADVTRENPVYDVCTSVPCIGTLPKVAAFRSDGIRSLHPTHSVWAAGAGAEDFVRGEENAPTPGAPGFAWSRLAEVGAKILLIGVGHDRNTFIHAVEEYADVPDRIDPEPYPVTIYDHDGNVHVCSFAGHRCSRTSDVSRQYVNFEKPLVELGAQQTGRLGNAAVRIVDARRCRDIIAAICRRTDTDLCIDIMEIPESLYK